MVLACTAENPWCWSLIHIAATPVLQLGDKADMIKKGVAAHEASTKIGPTTQQLLDALKVWLTEGAKMAQH